MIETMLAKKLSNSHSHKLIQLLFLTKNKMYKNIFHATAKNYDEQILR